MLAIPSRILTGFCNRNTNQLVRFKSLNGIIPDPIINNAWMD